METDVTRELGESGDVINNTLCKQSKNKRYHTNLQCHHIFDKGSCDFHMIYLSEMWQTWPSKCWNSQLLQNCLFWSYKFQLQVGLYTGALFIQQSLGWDLYLYLYSIDYSRNINHHRYICHQHLNNTCEDNLVLIKNFWGVRVFMVTSY